jgi:pilus assembly protein CpaE
VSETTVVLGLEDRSLQEEMLRFLEGQPRVRVLGAEDDGPGLARRIREAHPDAAVASPEVVRAAPDMNGAALYVVAQRETTEALRTAIRASARGFYLWPEEREALAREAASAARPAQAPEGGMGRVVSVFGARGGAGTTFLATHLAAACAAEGASTTLVDADPFFGDVGPALGVAPNGAVRTAADLAEVADELAWEHLDAVLYEHPRGFRVLLAPPEPAVPAPASLPDVVAALRPRQDAVIVHLPRWMDAALPAIEASDLVLVVVTLDVLAFRDARRTLGFLDEQGLAGKCRLVVNRSARAEVIPDDVERVFGMPPVAVIPADRAVGRAQDRGELLSPRSRAGAKLRDLAGHVLRERGA